MRDMARGQERGEEISVQLVRGFALFSAAIVLLFHWLPGGAPGLLPQRAAIAALLVVLVVATVISEAVQRRATLLLHAFAYGFSAWFLSVVAREGFSPERSIMLIVGVAGQGLLFFGARGLLLFYVVQVTLVSVVVALTPEPGVEPAVLIGGLAILTAASGIVALSRNQTTRHLQELSLVAHQVSAGLALVDPSGIIRWSSDRLGVIVEEEQPLVGRSLLALLGAEQSELATALLNRQGAAAELLRGQQWLSVRLIPLRRRAARLRTIAVIDDVTLPRARLERLLAVMTDALLVLDERGRLQAANHAAEALLGAARADMLGEPLVTFLAADGSDDIGHRLLFEVGGPDSQPQTRELRFADRHGAAIPTLVTAAALPVRLGEGPSTLLVIQDIRPKRSLERREDALEERLQRAQRLESLETLAGRVAHDANNLLVGVMGHAGLAAMSATGEVAARLEMIQAAAEKAAHLNTQLLALAGRDGSAAQPIDLAAFVADTAPLLRAAIAPQASLVLDLGDHVPLITGDSSRLQQALLSLVRNASEALEGTDGTVTVRVRAQTTETPIHIAVDPPLPAGRYAILEVEDTGTGIPAEVQDQMFAPDFSTRAPARGLGLAAMLGIVRAHGSGVVVDSSERGARLMLLLPETPGEPTPPPAPISRTSGRGAVLLVDDDDDVRDIAREALERKGYTVLAARDGVECLRIFAAEQARIRAILLDLNMPGMRGEEILRRLRASAPEVPVLITSGYAPSHIEGATGILHKPYRLRELTEAVDKMTSSDS
jgi:PAS domain S-box-containing protein